jgi:hypothetical protein
VPELELPENEAHMIVALAELEAEGLVEVAIGVDLKDAPHDPVGLGTRLTEAGAAALAETDPQLDPERPGAPGVLAMRMMERQARELREGTERLRAQLRETNRERRHLERLEKRYGSDQRTE